jgi:hypothetical protein
MADSIQTSNGSKMILGSGLPSSSTWLIDQLPPSKCSSRSPNRQKSTTCTAEKKKLLPGSSAISSILR